VSSTIGRIEVNAVLLPGAGSDEVFVRAAFGRPLAAVGVRLTTPAPRPGPELVDAYLGALDSAARLGPVLAGGVSLGAHVAAAWAVRNVERCAGLLLALPAWSGQPGDAPAALAALASAADVQRRGLALALQAATSAVTPWLARELRRSWPRYGENLAASLRAAARHPAPSAEELHTLGVPAGLVGCLGDPVHPVAVAAEWDRALPCSAFRTTTLDAIGVDREVLGEAATQAWLHASA
jgi:pimeloyl-ACP methyl ester carboxylesterase